ncbi:MAG: HesA/MoeB/ThiF family protein [Pseudomonadota bacterium]
MGVFIERFISFETLAFIGLLAGLFLYIRVLRRAAKAKHKIEPAQKSEDLSPTELERYARHIVLREWGGQGQKKLKRARVLVIGAGGLGCPVISYLAAAGVGRIGVIDDDAVSLSNLQRQVMYTEAHLDMPKVFAAEQVVKAQNPFVEFRPYHRKFTAEIAADLVADYDIVLDTSDSFETRQLTNRTCVALGKPMIFGALTQWEGQVSVFDATQGGCFNCLFPDQPKAGLAPNCAEAGVVGALPGVIGSVMSLECLKYITGSGKNLVDLMLIYDSLSGDWRRISLKRDKDCAVCGTKNDTRTGDP